MTDFNLTRLKRPQYGLLGLLTCLYSIYLGLVWRTGDFAYFGMSVLFLLATVTLIWENAASFTYRQEPVACFSGAMLIGWVIWQSVHLPDAQQPELRLLPFASALAVALIASGFQGLLQYRRELAIMFFLGVPSVLLSLIDISPLTATVAALLLAQIGFSTTQQGIALTSSIGTVEVYSSFSGIESITYLLGLAVVCLSLYPVCRSKQVLALLAAVLVGFGVNCVRVAIMATLAAPQDQKAFLYWHEGDGALIFSVVALVIFVGFYWVLHQVEIWQKRRSLLRSRRVKESRSRGIEE